MNTRRLIIVAIGVLILIAGLGMDTTKTTTTCHDSIDPRDPGQNCVETTYNDPAPQIVALILGIGFIAGGILAGGSDNTQQKASHQRNTGYDNSQRDVAPDDTFAAKLEQNKNKKGDRFNN